MKVVQWADLLRDAGEIAGRYVPQPAGIVIQIATDLAARLMSAGCSIDGCPAHIADELLRDPIHTGEAGLEARARALGRAAMERARR